MTENNTVIPMVKAWLIEHGFDGLFNSDADCACLRDDLAPCMALDIQCEAGMKAPCPPDCGEHDWHIVRREAEQEKLGSTPKKQ